MRMRGPHGKGHAEMAVSRVKGSGPETPDLENFPVEDFDDQVSGAVNCETIRHIKEKKILELFKI